MTLDVAIWIETHQLRAREPGPQPTRHPYLPSLALRVLRLDALGGSRLAVPASIALNFGAAIPNASAHTNLPLFLQPKEFKCA